MRGSLSTEQEILSFKLGFCCCGPLHLLLRDARAIKRTAVGSIVHRSDVVQRHNTRAVYTLLRRQSRAIQLVCF